MTLFLLNYLKWFIVGIAVVLMVYFFKRKKPKSIVAVLVATFIALAFDGTYLRQYTVDKNAGKAQRHIPTISTEAPEAGELTDRLRAPELNSAERLERHKELMTYKIRIATDE